MGLRNIAPEASRETPLPREANAFLQRQGGRALLNFTGKVEAGVGPMGAVDVVVCDGFSGNVLLKSIEGTAAFMGSLVSRMFKKNALTKVAALLCSSGIKSLKKLLDYREIGGTQFLGIRKPVIKAHGSSDAKAFRNAVGQAMEAAGQDFSQELEAGLRILQAKENEA